MKVGRIVAAGAVALAACGVLGMSPTAVRASSAAVPTWTQQVPATSPSARSGALMAYDAATGTVVLVGGVSDRGGDRGTWTWDGSTWTKQHPATSPYDGVGMAYDAATGTVVLLGSGSGTWTWDGSTWTRQHPATSPGKFLRGSGGASMAYDAATGTVVLFGGEGRNGLARRGT